jgi:elongation factor G
MQDLADEWHQNLIESAAEASEELMEKFVLERRTTGYQDDFVVQNALTQSFFDLFFSQFFTVQAMLDAVVDYLPSPVDVPAINGILDDGKDTPADAEPQVTRMISLFRTR